MKFDIGIDARMIENTGIGTYIQNLIREFRQTDQEGRIVLFGRPRSLKDTGFSSVLFQSPLYSIQEQIEYVLKINQCRLWHAPHYNVPFFKGRIKLVVTIHDLIHWLFQNSFSDLKKLYAKTMLKRAVTIADQIITVSQKTKEDLIEHCQADSGKISVIYEAAHPIFKPSTDGAVSDLFKTKYGMTKPYFIYVGMLKPHKNVLWLVDQFLDFRNKGLIQGNLILIGRKTQDNYCHEIISKTKPQNGIYHFQNMPFSDLVLFYQHAICLIHPSLYEGFGLTLLEAMASGTPVIASRVGSIPEVAGEAGYLIESSDSKGLLEGMTRFEQDPAFRRHYVEKGLMHSRQFTWQKTAEQTFKVYTKLLSL